MSDPKKNLAVSKTGATISLVTSAPASIADPIPANCRPVDDPLASDCFPDYHCAPEQEAPAGSDALSLLGERCMPDADCPDYACCPEKAEQDCDPNV